MTLASFTFDKAIQAMLRSGSSRLKCMPKKTRKQKILADKRRHDVGVSSDTTSPASFQFKASAIVTKPATPENIEELLAIRTDITKTIVLAALAIGAEFIVYWRYFAK